MLSPPALTGYDVLICFWVAVSWTLIIMDFAAAAYWEYKCNDDNAYDVSPPLWLVFHGILNMVSYFFTGVYAWRPHAFTDALLYISILVRGLWFILGCSVIIWLGFPCVVRYFSTSVFLAVLLGDVTKVVCFMIWNRWGPHNNTQ